MTEITRKAVEERVRRHYRREGFEFHKSRTPEELATCGCYFLTENNHVCGPHMDDLEDHARTIGVLQPHEAMVEATEEEWAAWA
jgi:hypothetical protein